jgi:hypothetical protein
MGKLTTCSSNQDSGETEPGSAKEHLGHGIAKMRAQNKKTTSKRGIFSLSLFLF